MFGLFHTVGLGLVLAWKHPKPQWKRGEPGSAEAKGAEVLFLLLNGRECPQLCPGDKPVS